MKISTWIFNLGAIAVCLVILSLDAELVSKTEQQVMQSCDTRTAYDKSGSLYCVDSSLKSVKVAGK